MGTPGLFVPTIPEYQAFLKDIYPTYEMTYLNDISSALWNTSFHMGEVLGPILGGYLVTVIGFPFTSSIFGWLIALLAIVYFLRFFKDFFKVN